MIACLTERLQIVQNVIQILRIQFALQEIVSIVLSNLAHVFLDLLHHSILHVRVVHFLSFISKANLPTSTPVKNTNLILRDCEGIKPGESRSKSLKVVRQ